jgi:hypothetical protein
MIAKDHIVRTALFVCDCQDIAHNIILQLCDFNNYYKPHKVHPSNIELCVYTQLNSRFSFFGRIWQSIKYICGYNSFYGHYDSMLIQERDIHRIYDILDSYKILLDKANFIYNKANNNKSI